MSPQGDMGNEQEQLFQRCNKARIHCQERRKITVESLREAANEVDKIEKGCKVGNVVSNGFGIGSGGVGLAGGIILLAGTGGAALVPLGVTCLVLGIVSATGKISTGLIKKWLISEKGQEFKDILQKDKHAFESLAEELKRKMTGPVNALQATALSAIDSNVFETTGIANREIVKQGVKVAAGSLTCIINGVVIIVSAVEMGMNIKDLLKDKESAFGKYMREKADELEEQLEFLGRPIGA